MSNQAKVLRGQMRQVVQEILPELIQQELKTALYKKLAEDMTSRVKAIEDNVKAVLDQLDQRSKDTLDYLVRQSIQVPQMNVPTEESKS